MRRLAAIAALWAAATAFAHAGGVVMLSGISAAEGRVESGLRFPDGSRLDVDAIARGARGLGARDTSTLLFYPDSGTVQRLEELPPDQRVVFSCLAQDSEIYEPQLRSLTTSAPNGLDPAAWVAVAPGRLVWWRTVPEVVACGLPVALLDAAPASLVFGDVLVGSSAQRDVVVSNIGRIELDVGSVTTQGAGFALVQNGCDQRRLLPGTSCTLRVGFTPADGGDLSGSVRLPNSGLQPVATVPLTGRGKRPAAIVVDHAALAFGDAIVGATIRSSVSVSNGGDAALPLGAAMLSGAGFAIVANACDGVTLAAAQACVIDVEFAPSASGAFAGSLSVVRTDGGAALDVPLSGRGIAPAVLAVDPVALAFGNVVVGESPRHLVTVSNSGEAALQLGAMSTSDASFSITGNTCDGVTLAAAQTCAIEVQFAPTLPGAHAGSLQVARGDGGTSAVVPLSGDGVAPGALTVDRLSIDYGDVAVGQSLRRTVTLSNSGGSALPIGTVSVTGGGFAIVLDDCSNRSLAAGANCEIALDFTPTAAGASTGQLAIPHGVAATAQVALQGTGTQAVPSGPKIFRSGFE